MDTNITSLERIRLEARQAAAKYSTVLEACPYPFGTGAAIEFTREFQRARDEALDALMEDQGADECPHCTCTDEHGVEELDFNRCSCCGKPINP